LYIRLRRIKVEQIKSGIERHRINPSTGFDRLPTGFSIALRTGALRAGAENTEVLNPELATDDTD
jgi:hypothetical protein